MKRAETESYVHLESDRVAWVDYLKGASILLVVMMHSVLGVEKALDSEGWMHVIVATAQPIRMPAFFLVAGLFLNRTIDRPLDRYVDSKVLHFAYFYVLWLTIQFVFKAPGIALSEGPETAVAAYLTAFIQPFGTLWFIYLLPVFLMTTRLLRRLPVMAVVASAAILQIMPIHTGSVIIDEFARYYVWFFLGYAFSETVFRLARFSADHCVPALFLSAAVIAMIGVLAYWFPDGSSVPVSQFPVISLLLGFVGTASMVAICASLERFDAARFIRWCGAHSLVIYLAFFLPMAASRTILIRIGPISDVGTLSFLVWVAAVVGPIILFWIIEHTGYGRFLFERPAWARLRYRPAIA
jgi:uncharacterized membrane protein YcfT